MRTYIFDEEGEVVVLPALGGVGEVSMAELTQEKNASGGLVESPGEAGFPETMSAMGAPLCCVR